MAAFSPVGQAMAEDRHARADAAAEERHDRAESAADDRAQQILDMLQELAASQRGGGGGGGAAADVDVGAQLRSITDLVEAQGDLTVAQLESLVVQSAHKQTIDLVHAIGQMNDEDRQDTLYQMREHLRSAFSVGLSRLEAKADETQAKVDEIGAAVQAIEAAVDAGVTRRVPRSNLPQAIPLAHRDTEIARALELIQPGNGVAVSVTGEAGAGKSSLAVAVALAWVTADRERRWAWRLACETDEEMRAG